VKYNYNDQVKEKEVGRACSMHGEKNAYRILVGKLEEIHYEDLGIGG
jgi:hypothetical protein